MNYLYGFMSAGLVYSFLHWVLPDMKLDAFVQNDSSPKELQQLYGGRWDVTVAEASETSADRPWTAQEKGSEPATVSV